MVNAKMRMQVKQELHRLERDRHIKILYAVESGSRAWGFPSPDSDYDIRFIYVRPLNSYLGVAPRRDVLEPRDLPEMGEIDLSGWDVTKALGLAAKSNPSLLEWLRSPIIYHEQGDFAEQLRGLTCDYSFHALMSHYSSMAKTQYVRHLNGTGEQVRYKKYFYALYPIFAVLYVNREITLRRLQPPRLPPISFEELVSELQENSDVRAITPFIRDLLRLKTATLEAEDQPRAAVIDEFLAKYIELTRTMAKEAPDDRQPSMMGLEELCQTTIRRYGY